jgi:hypothetical protein
MERQCFSPRYSRRQLLANAAIVDASPLIFPVQAAYQIGCEIGQSNCSASLRRNGQSPSNDFLTKSI